MYVPGMISLLVLPVLIIKYLIPYTHKTEQYVLEVKCEDLPHCCMGAEPFSGRYIDVELTGNPIENKMLMNKSERLLHEIYSKQDTTIVVHYTLNGTTTYKTFVSVFNQFKKTNIDNYVLDEYGIWAGLKIPYDCARGYHQHLNNDY